MKSKIRSRYDKNKTRQDDKTRQDQIRPVRYVTCKRRQDKTRPLKIHEISEVKDKIKI